MSTCRAARPSSSQRANGNSSPSAASSRSARATCCTQPFQGHAFRPLSSNSRLIVMFQGMDMRYAKERSDYMQAHFPEIAGTPEFKNQMQLHTHAQPRDNSYYYDIAPEGDSPAHRRFGEGIRSHALPGMTLNLIIARYETHGVKEVWEACMKSGLRMEFATPRYDHRRFWVREGKIKFNIDGTEFAAGPACSSMCRLSTPSPGDRGGFRHGRPVCPTCCRIFWRAAPHESKAPESSATGIYGGSPHDSEQAVKYTYDAGPASLIIN